MHSAHLVLLVLSLACAAAACSGPAPEPSPAPPGAASTRRTVTLIVTNGTVVTMDAGRRIIPQGAVAIDGAAIVAVDTTQAIAARFAAARTIDASGQIVMPGLINTHGHAPMVLYRGLADDLPLQQWLEQYIFPAEAKTVSPEFVRAGTRLAALEMVASGTTTFADMYYFEEAIADETRKAGLRAVLGQAVIRFPVADAQTPAEGLARAERFIQAFKDDPLITPAVAPHAMYTLDAEHLQAARALSLKYGVPTLIHLAETRGEVNDARAAHRLSPAGFLDRLGFLGAGVVAAHTVWASDADVMLLAQRGVAVSHNPESNMKLASGVAPVPAFLDAGITVGLGTDGAASNNDLDMFEAMRAASLLHKVQTLDPTVMNARTVVEMATLGGARSLGLDDRVGSLEPGKRADLIIVDTGAARQQPAHDVYSQLVYTTRGDDVRTTVVDGRVLMHEGQMLTLDETAVLDEARQWRTRVDAAVR